VRAEDGEGAGGGAPEKFAVLFDAERGRSRMLEPAVWLESIPWMQFTP